MGEENCEGHARLLSSGKLQICTKNKITTKYLAAILESVQDILSKPAITPHSYASSGNKHFSLYDVFEEDVENLVRSDDDMI